MNPVETAQAVQNSGVEPLWIAVAVVVLLMVVGVLWVFRRSDADEPDTRYQDSAYDPVAAAEPLDSKLSSLSPVKLRQLNPRGRRGRRTNPLTFKRDAQSTVVPVIDPEVLAAQGCSWAAKQFGLRSEQIKLSESSDAKREKKKPLKPPSSVLKTRSNELILKPNNAPPIGLARQNSYRFLG